MKRVRVLARIVALTLVALVALGPASAPAASVALLPGSGTLFVTGDIGESNDITVTLSGGTYTVVDAGVAVIRDGDGAAGCSVAANVATCLGVSVFLVQIDVSDLDDRVTLDVSTPSFVDGSSGNDTLLGSLGTDRLIGGLGDDILNGRDGDDEVIGELVAGSPSEGRNTILGGAGADALDGGGGPDHLAGSAGNDTLSAGGGADLLEGEDGDDVLSGGPGDDSMLGGAGNDGLGVDSREGVAGVPLERGNDSMDGGDGNDRLEPGLGPGATGSDADSLIGGAGADVVSYRRREVGITASLDALANDGAPGEGDSLGLDVETLVGGSSDDVLVGGPGGETIDGGPGSDRITGLGGADTLEGGTQDGGSDVLAGGDGADVVRGGPGDDRLTGDRDADSVSGGGGADSATGGHGNDTVSGGTGVDDLSGGEGNDALRGGDPLLPGSDDRDAIDGGSGDDVIAGDEGADRLAGGRGNDVVAGGPGRDTASYERAGTEVTVTLDGQPNDGEGREHDNVQIDIENVDGALVADTITGSSADNVLDGRVGEDYLDGASGRDRLRGGGARDVVRSRDGNADLVNCGRSVDFAIVDRKDRVRGNCERKDTGVRNRPKRGEEVVVQPASGSNEFGLRGMERDVPLEDRINLPLESRIDAARPRAAIDVTAAARGGDGSEELNFSEGASEVSRREGGLTELRLIGDLSGCRAGASKLRGHKSRRGRRRKGHGKTSGNIPGGSRATTASPARSSATASRSAIPITGRASRSTPANERSLTDWIVEDRCDGTLTSVLKGTVAVSDFERKRDVVLQAGDSYLARDPIR